MASDVAPVAAGRTILPEGTLPVAVGLVVAGLSAYGFLSLLGLGLDDAAAKPVTQLWFATFILAPGFFLPVEQEVGRAISHRRALGEGSRPVVQRAVVLALGLLGIVYVVLLSASTVITEELFDGSWVLFGCLLLSFTSYAFAHFVRGVLAGTGRFPSYGLFMGSEGVMRVAGAAVLVALGVESPGAFGLLIGLPPLIALLISTKGQRPLTRPGPPAAWGEITQNLGWLVLGSVFAAALLNAGPITVDLLAHRSDAEIVSAFGFAVLVARVPLFMFQAVQAALLPRLAQLAARGQYSEFSRGLTKLLGAVGVIGVVAVAGAWLLGPWGLELVFGVEMSRRTLALLALASALYMLALAIAQAVIALHGHATVAVGWMTAMAVFVVVTSASSQDLLLRVELGLVAAALGAAAVFATSLRARLAAEEQPDVDAVLAMVDTPIEP